MRLIKIAINLHQLGSKTAAKKLLRIIADYEEGFSFDTITEQIYKELADPSLKEKIRKAILAANAERILETESTLEPAVELANLGSQLDMLPDDEVELLLGLLIKKGITKPAIHLLGQFIRRVADEFDEISRNPEIIQSHDLALKIDKIYRGIFALGQRLQQI